MVRHKSRYFAFECQWPQLDYYVNNDNEKEGKGSDCWLVEQVKDRHVAQLLRDEIHHQFGMVGAAMTGSLSVKYYNSHTSAGIVRISRSQRDLLYQVMGASSSPTATATADNNSKSNHDDDVREECKQNATSGDLDTESGGVDEIRIQSEKEEKKKQILMKMMNNQWAEVKFVILHVSGTMRKCQWQLIKHNRTKLIGHLDELLRQERQIELLEP